MNTKLKEGQVVKSWFFATGVKRNEEYLEVGDYRDIDLRYTSGNPVFDEERRVKEYLITSVSEKHPQITIGNRTSSYENTIYAIELNEDGSYNENNSKIKFSTCYVYRGSIGEQYVEVIREMKKTYV